MYFGALGVGADCSVGALAMHLINQQHEKISLIFKKFSADFHRRAESDVDFSCNQGNQIAHLIARAAASDDRVDMEVDVIAALPGQSDDPVTTFKLTLSLKRRP